MYSVYKLLSFIALFTSIENSAWAQSKDLRVASVLQSNMVIQQAKPFKVWGTALPGAKVSVTTDWNTDTVSVTVGGLGNFCALINVPLAKKGDYSSHRLKVFDSKRNMLFLDNLLIGDVWLCSGQSNMQFPVKELVNAQQELATAYHPAIRLFSGGLNFSDTPISEIKGEWKECSAAAVDNFSAVSYFFAKKIQQQLNIPVGIIFSGVGASAVQAYIPREVLAADSILNRQYLAPYLNSPRSKEKIDEKFSFEKVTRPSLLFNAMINPLINLSLKGFCWYQGEANHFERESYTKATKAMIKAWRQSFQQDNLPFYYVQIAPFNHGKENSELAFDAFFREAQEKVTELNNTGMVVTMDIGDAKDLHPKNKKPVGERLAKLALNCTYEFEDTVYLGPHYHTFRIQGKHVVVWFNSETIAGGLKTSDGKAPKFFYVSGKDKVFYPAKATILGNEIWASSKMVRRPVAVRYAFFNYPVTNLTNSSGLPAVPFRTDNWPESGSTVAK